MEGFLNLFSMVNDPGIQKFLFPVRIIMGFAGVVMLLFCSFIVLRTSWLKYSAMLDVVEFFTFRPYGLRKMTKQWNRIMARLETGIEAEYKLGIIEADSLLAGVLERMGFKGATLGDRMQTVTSAIISNIDDMWLAHQTRNNIVHDPDYRLSLIEAEKTLKIYEVAFKNLDLL